MTVVFFGKNGGNGLVSIVSATEYQLLSQSSMDSTFMHNMNYITHYNQLATIGETTKVLKYISSTSVSIIID